MDSLLKACNKSVPELIQAIEDNDPHDPSLNYPNNWDIHVWNQLFYEACLNQKIDIINYIIERGQITNFEKGLVSACRNSDGDNQTIQLMISLIGQNMSINNWERCLVDCCDYHNVNMVKFLIEMGANNFNESLLWACEFREDEDKSTDAMKIIDLLIERGANNFIECFYVSCYFGNLKLLSYLYSKIPNKYEINWPLCINTALFGMKYGRLIKRKKTIKTIIKYMLEPVLLRLVLKQSQLLPEELLTIIGSYL